MLVYENVTDDQVGPMIAAMKADGYTNIVQHRQNDGKWSLFGDFPVAEPDQELGQQRLIDALIQVESGGNDFAIGDQNLNNPAYGCLQIRLPVCIDVNKHFGTNIKPQDMLGNRALSVQTFKNYMMIYATQARIGRPVTDEDRARIWNGGPNGYQSGGTHPYWNRVQQVLSV